MSTFGKAISTILMLGRRAGSTSIYTSVVGDKVEQMQRLSTNTFSCKILCQNLIGSYANCDMQLFLAQKCTMKQEASTNLHNLYKKQLQITVF